MDRFAAMGVFCKVVEVGSFAAAADRLDMSTSAVSRQVAQLEALLQSRLLNRTTRRLSLTENGRAYYERCLQLLSDLEEAEEMVGNAMAAPRGTLRITASISFGATHLAPALAAFRRLYPQMKFDAVLADRQQDLIEEGIDLAIRVGELGNQNLVARPIGTARILLCASPTYLAARGTPDHPDALRDHDCLTYAYAADSQSWRFTSPAGAPISIPVSGPAHANNGNMLGAMAAQGMGLTLAPDFILGPLVKSGELVTLLDDWTAKPLNIYAVYPSRRHLSAKVRSFVGFMQEWLSGEEG